MNWKEQLRQLELKKDWDTAIEFMQHVIEKNPNDIDAYLLMNYLLMNLLVEEDHNEDKHDYYEYLTKKYFDESYTKFSNDPEYLYYTGRTACMSEWFFDVNLEPSVLIKKAQELNPSNLVYQWNKYFRLPGSIDERAPENLKYAQLVLQENSPIKKELATKGSLGEYIFGMMQNWAIDLLTENPQKFNS